MLSEVGRVGIADSFGSLNHFTIVLHISSWEWKGWYPIHILFEFALQTFHANESLLVEEVQQDIDVASDVVEDEIAAEPNVNDVSSDVIEEETAASDVEDVTGDDSKREANQSFAKFKVWRINFILHFR